MNWIKWLFYFVDINECGGERDNCDGNATCHNTDGSFSCVCNEGFSGTGEECEGKEMKSNFGTGHSHW